MRYFLLSFIFLSFYNFQANSQSLVFQDFFETKTLQISYYLVGDANSELFVLQDLKKQEQWSGKLQLRTSDVLNLGNFRFNVIDSASNKMLYTQGFCSLFEEWQSTFLAQTNSKSFYHVNNVPFPKKTIKYQLQKRRKDGVFFTVHEFYINPNNYFIKQEAPLKNKYSVIQNSGDPHKKIDIAFLAEGYTKLEMQKFNNDVKRIWQYFTQIPPFSKYADRFNIYAVESVSQESGTDIPGKHVYKNTVLNFSFYTFNVERYLTSFDLKAMHNNASCVPYDYIFVVINSGKYGGGGFYYYYSSATSDNELSLKVAIHEFGHAFAGLADEYYNAETSYNEYFNLKIEPWELNITTLVNFESKWKHMVSENTPIPTPRTKQYENKIGVFEGGGYMAKGIYSPAQDCRMKSNKPEGFCPVCSQAIIKVINYLSE